MASSTMSTLRLASAGTIAAFIGACSPAQPAPPAPVVAESPKEPEAAAEPPYRKGKPLLEVRVWRTTIPYNAAIGDDKPDHFLLVGIEFKNVLAGNYGVPSSDIQ